MNDLLLSRVSALQGQLWSALAAEGVTGSEVLTAQVLDFRPLHWAAPPIYPYTMIGDDAPTLFLSPSPTFRLYTELPIQQVYDNTIRRLKEKPKSVVSEDGTWLEYPAIRLLGLRQEARAIFSGPTFLDDGSVHPESLQTFALEFVAVCAAARLAPIRKGSSDFYIDCHSFRGGVKNGQPIGAEETAAPGEFIEHLLAAPRGCGWDTHTLDALDRIQFWCEANDRLTQVPALLDLLPTLRATLPQKAVDDLTAKMLWREEKAPKEKVPVANRLSPQEFDERLDKALAIAEDIRIPDPIRISQLVELLVPWVISEGGFYRHIWDCHKLVSTLRAKDVSKIVKTLVRLKQTGKPPRVEVIQPKRRISYWEGSS